MKIFTEKQRFNQWWIYAILFGTLFVMILPMLLDYAEIKDNKAAKIALIISFVSVLAGVFIIRMLTLHTRIDEKGVHYRFSPFHRKQYLITWNEMSEIYVRKYNAITEYGGWGFRGTIFRRGGKAFNVLGNKGIQIVLKSGKKLLIGTQKDIEAERTINTYRSKYLKFTE